MASSGLEPQVEYLREVGLRPDTLPRHVAIIMDSNGRWAQRLGLPRIEGHRRGVNSVRAVTEECCRLGVRQLTLYCLSVENWKRPKTELDLLMKLLEQYLIQERRMLEDNNIVLKVIGRRTGLPPYVVKAMEETLELSSRNTGMTLCLAINYGGRTELVDAVQAIARDVQAGVLDPEAVDEAVLAGKLYTGGMADPDLLIRTAGEMRVSNFLLWQISYAEIWVADVCWPDFRSEHLHRALYEYGQRERRYGGLGN